MGTVPVRESPDWRCRRSECRRRRAGRPGTGRGGRLAKEGESALTHHRTRAESNFQADGDGRLPLTFGGVMGSTPLALRISLATVPRRNATKAPGGCGAQIC